jgi:lipoate-protein ligase A
MTIDRAFLSQRDARFRIYLWDTFSITYGLFVHPQSWIHTEVCDSLGVSVVKRPTGGGILFHGGDISFSLFFPVSHRLYAVSLEERAHWINKKLLQALAPWLPMTGISQDAVQGSHINICMLQQGPLDLIWKGRKIVGAAQRKCANGILHQASIFVHPFLWSDISKVISNETIPMMQSTCISLEEIISSSIRNEDIIQAVMNTFCHWSDV